ncbi:MAG: TnpV protein [Lachnospiraceae bacterium]|nr:TnpV protein [Lachnospiraceae bacterium]
MEAMTYHEVDGLLYPDLEIREQEQKNPGKYGLLAMEYLKENEPLRYRTLVRFGILMERMEAVNEEAHTMIDQIMKDYLETHKPNDPHSTMEMWKIRQQGMMIAEEIVLHQIVYKFH